jgi:AcrR family transcriptional regulator
MLATASGVGSDETPIWTNIMTVNHRRGQRCHGSPNPVRDQILSAAEALFAEHGRDATTTEKISQRARVSPGLLFYYFSNKDELFAALIEERSPLQVFKAEIDMTPPFAKRGTAFAALTALGIEFVRALRARQQVVQILLRELSMDERAAHHFRLLCTYPAALIARYLRQDLAPSAVSVDSAAGMFVSHLALACATDGAFDTDSFVSAAVGVLLDGRSANAREIDASGNVVNAPEIHNG